MSDENNEFINTEEPLEVSEELLKELMEASAEVHRGEGLVSHENVMIHIQHLIDEYGHLPPYDNSLVIKDKKQQNEIVNKI